LTGLAGSKFLTKNLFQKFFKMKTFTPSSSKNVVTSLLYDVFNWVTPGKAQPAACSYLEFLL